MSDRDYSQLSADQMLQISRLCDEFERAWQSGACPAIEVYLRDVEPALAAALLQELVPLEINYRRRAGEEVSRHDYQTRFPSLETQCWDRLFEAAATRVEGLAGQESLELPPTLGDYAVLGRIGGGGMGAVYKAVHQRMDRIVALKVLRPEIQRDPALLRRFDREVRAAARLVHPHIVAALDAREQDGLHFLITEFVDGQDLEALVRTRGPLPVGDAVDYILQAAKGLDYAHRQGIVHRDIKPANLLLDSQRTVKILDMGLARLDVGDEVEATHLTRTGMVMGTAAYMAPEQARDTRTADARSDLYSLGCTLFYLLTGRLMYPAATLVDTILSHVSEPIPSLAQANSQVPTELEQIFRKLVAKRPEDRFQSAAELLSTLERFRARYQAARRAVRGAATPRPPGNPAPAAVPAPMTAAAPAPAAAAPAPVAPPLPVAASPAPPPGPAAPPLPAPPAPTPVPPPLPRLVRPGSFSDVGTTPLPVQALPPVGERKTPVVRTLLTGRVLWGGAALAVVCVAGLLAFVALRPWFSDQPQPDPGKDDLGVVFPPPPVPSPDVPPSPPTRAPGVRFNGRSSYIAVPTLVPEAGQSYTLEVLTVLHSQQTSNVISWLGPDWLALYVTPRDGWGLARRVAGRSLLVVAGRDAVLDRPVHVAGTYTGNSLRLFVDGEVLPEQTSTYELPETSGGLYLGGVRSDLLPADQNQRFYAGIVTAVRLSRGVRYADRFSPPEALTADAETLALFDFPEGQGNTTRDRGPAGHTGQLVDVEWNPR